MNFIGVPGKGKKEVFTLYETANLFLHRSANGMDVVLSQKCTGFAVLTADGFEDDIVEEMIEISDEMTKLFPELGQKNARKHITPRLGMYVREVTKTHENITLGRG